MSQSKIVNCQRSPSALVFFKLKLHHKVLRGDNLKILTEELQQYVRDHPRIWDSMLFIRQDHIGGVSETPDIFGFETDSRFVLCSLCFQHVLSWQSSMRIMISRGELFCHIDKVCEKLGVKYDTPLPRQVAMQNMPSVGNAFGTTADGSPPTSTTTADPFKQSAPTDQKSSIPF